MFLKLTGCSSKCEVLLAQWLISSANYSSESVQQTKKRKKESARKLAMRNCHGVFVYLSRPRWAARWLWWRPGRTLARFHYSRLFPCQSRALCLTTVSRGVLPLISGNCGHGLECFILFSRLDFALLCVFFSHSTDFTGPCVYSAMWCVHKTQANSPACIVLSFLDLVAMKC